MDTLKLQEDKYNSSINGVDPRHSAVPKIKIYNPAAWNDADRAYHTCEVHAGFIARTEANIRELEQYVRVSDNAKLHMYQLLDGDMTLPWILLQNPTKTQHYEKFEDMVEGTDTLTDLQDWICRGTGNSDMSLDVMPVMDVFPLVEDGTLKALVSPREREQVTRIVFRITMDLIWTYGPRTIISMQCHAKGGPFKDFIDKRGYFQHHVAQGLSSSMEKARLSKVESQLITEYDVYKHLNGNLQRDNYVQNTFGYAVIMGLHPTGINRRYNTRSGRDDSIAHKKRLIGMLGEQYSGYNLARLAAADNHGRTSLHACYQHVLSEQRSRAVRAQFSHLADDDIRQICLHGVFPQASPTPALAMPPPVQIKSEPQIKVEPQSDDDETTVPIRAVPEIPPKVKTEAPVAIKKEPVGAAPESSPSILNPSVPAAPTLLAYSPPVPPLFSAPYVQPVAQNNSLFAAQYKTPLPTFDVPVRVKQEPPAPQYFPSCKPAATTGVTAEQEYFLRSVGLASPVPPQPSMPEALPSETPSMTPSARRIPTTPKASTPTWPNTTFPPVRPAVTDITAEQVSFLKSVGLEPPASPRPSVPQALPSGVPPMAPSTRYTPITLKVPASTSPETAFPLPRTFMTDVTTDQDSILKSAGLRPSAPPRSPKMSEALPNSPPSTASSTTRIPTTATAFMPTTPNTNFSVAPPPKPVFPATSGTPTSGTPNMIRPSPPRKAEPRTLEPPANATTKPAPEKSDTSDDVLRRLAVRLEKMTPTKPEAPKPLRLSLGTDISFDLGVEPPVTAGADTTELVQSANTDAIAAVLEEQQLAADLYAVSVGNKPFKLSQDVDPAFDAAGPSTGPLHELSKESPGNSQSGQAEQVEHVQRAQHTAHAENARQAKWAPKVEQAEESERADQTQQTQQALRALEYQEICQFLREQRTELQLIEDNFVKLQQREADRLARQRLGIDELEAAVNDLLARWGASPSKPKEEIEDKLTDGTPTGHGAAVISVDEGDLKTPATVVRQEEVAPEPVAAVPA